MDFGKKLKELRVQAGLTQKQLGSMMGVTYSVISFYESHKYPPSPEVLVKLASIFRVSTDYLLGLETGQSIDVSGLDEEDLRVVKQMVDLLRKKKSSIDSQMSEPE